MLAAVRSAALVGIDAFDVIVEVDAAQGLPQWTIVGLAASAVKESRERVGAALVNSGVVMPPRRVTVSLAPADVRKEGTAFDLPIAIGILMATGQLDAAAAESRMFVGELGLDGGLRPMRGALSIARHAHRTGMSTLVLPARTVAEAARVSALRLSSPLTLSDLVHELRAGALTPANKVNGSPAARGGLNEFGGGVGQERGKRAPD